MKIPTDSLYKFITFFGIALFLGSGHFMVKINDNTVKTIDDMQKASVEISNSQKNYTEQVVKAMEVARQIAHGELKDGTKETIISTSELQRVRDDQIAFFEFVKLKYEYQTEKFRLLNLLFFTTLVFGLGFSSIGFWCWFSRLQVHIDKKFQSGEFSLSIDSSESNIEL